MKRTLTSISLAALAAASLATIAWVSGFDFDHRGITVGGNFAMCLFLTAIVGVGTFFYPGWDEKK